MSTALTNAADGGSPERGLEVVRDPSVITAIRDVNQSEVADFLHSKGVPNLTVRENGAVVGQIPFELIDTTEVPLRELHVNHIKGLIDESAERFGGDGQDQPLETGMIPGVDLLKIADGFHRSKAQQRRGMTEVFAGVLRSSWDDLYNSRIPNALNSFDHKAIRFARVVIWMNEIWELTGFPEHMTLEQAALLAGMGGSGAGLKVTPDVREASNEWIGSHSNAWNLAPMTIHSHVKIASDVDPELISVTQERQRGDEITGPNQEMIKVLSEQIPKNYELQQMVVDAAVDHQLDPRRVRALCEHIKNAKTNGQAAEVIATIDWDELEPANKSKGTARLSRYSDPRTAGERVLEQSIAEIQSALERAEAIAASGEPLTPEQRRKVEEVDAKIRPFQGLLLRYVLAVDKILDLPDAPEPAQKAAKKAVAPVKKAVAKRGRGKVTAADKYAQAKAARENGGEVRVGQPRTRDDHEHQVGKNEFETGLLAFLNGASDVRPVIDSLQTARSAERLIRTNEKGFPMADRVEDMQADAAGYRKLFPR